MVLVWWITDDSPNLPNFPPAKHSRYAVHMVYGCTELYIAAVYTYVATYLQNVWKQSGFVIRN